MFEYEDPNERYVPIPPGLDDMAPGPELASVLDGIDVTQVSGYDRIRVLQAQQRWASWVQAQMYATMAAIVDAVADSADCGDPVEAPEMAAAEIRCALRLTHRAADDALLTALDLQQRLPQLHAALEADRIEPRRVRTILWGTSSLSDEAAQDLVDSILDRASQLTTGQLAALIRKLGIDLDPDHAQQRYENALEERHIHVEATGTGTANLLGLDLAPDQAAAASRRINLLARTLKTSSETRTMDQLRADVLVDLLTGHQHHREETARGVVDLTVDLTTLAELTDHPGDLNGYGPVIADVARQVAERQHGSEWRYVVTDPNSDMPLHVGTTARRPTVSQRRVTKATHRTCVFPGCRMPAKTCDLDHRIPWARGGTTRVENLTPLCRHDHRTRHHGWTYEPLPNGDHLWTSPLHHTYTTSGTPP